MESDLNISVNDSVQSSSDVVAAPATLPINQHSPSLIANLDFLRSVAVLLVVVCHTLPVFGIESAGLFSVSTMGRIGVLIFFVHTCLVLMKSMDRQLARTLGSGTELLDQSKLKRLFGPFYADFLVRRAFRIYPLSIFVVLVFYGWQAVFPNIGTGFDRGSYLTLLDGRGYFFANIFLVMDFAEKHHYIIAPLWTLPLELQMYVMLPLIFLFCRSRSIWSVWALWAVSCVLTVIWKKHQDLPFVLAFIPCFLAGVFAWKRYGMKPVWPFWTLPMFLFIGILIYMVAYTKLKLHLFVGFPFCLGLGFLLPMVTPMTFRPLRIGAEYIARYSYSIYLTHLAATWIAFRCCESAPAAIQWLLFILLFVGFPVLFYHGIELPGIRIGSKVAAKLFERSLAKETKKPPLLLADAD